MRSRIRASPIQPEQAIERSSSKLLPSSARRAPHVESKGRLCVRTITAATSRGNPNAAVASVERAFELKRLRNVRGTNSITRFEVGDGPCDAQGAVIGTRRYTEACLRLPEQLFAR